MSGVYPRVGGETIQDGNLIPGGLRSIPAWAGKPGPWPRKSAGGLSPRGRGNRQNILVSCVVGLSPRGRGNQSRRRSRTRKQVYPRVGGAAEAPGVARSIPAWAGKPAAPSDWVYPRVGGETLVRNPRVGGETLLVGLSPRGRGNHHQRSRPSTAENRVYPRVGGETPASAADRCQRVYPRVGGETMAGSAPRTVLEGLSPRGRGNQPAVRRADRSFAWGLSPRGRGNHRSAGGKTIRSKGLSPRGRGNRRRFKRDLDDGSIPAWAGKPSSGSGSIPAWAGKPPLDRVADATKEGLSPRGRGNPRAWRGDARSQRGSIPAWAGKPSAPIGCPDVRTMIGVYPRVGGVGVSHRAAG